jgi:hypothetical protein
MIQARPIHAAVRFVDWTVLTLLTACAMAEFSAAQTASASANRHRAQLTQNSVATSANLPTPSNLGAISASVDAKVDRRVNADRQNGIVDPSLSPLRIMAPNVNGEDDSSTQMQPGTPTPFTGGRAKYSAITAIPQSTSSWSPGRIGRGQSAPVLRDQFPVDPPKMHPWPIHSSDRPGRTDTTWSGPTPISGAKKDLRQKRVHGSTQTDLHKARHQQEIYLRDCTKLYLPELECRAKLRQQRLSTSRHGPTEYDRKSLAAIR